MKSNMNSDLTEDSQRRVFMIQKGKDNLQIKIFIWGREAMLHIIYFFQNTAVKVWK